MGDIALPASSIRVAGFACGARIRLARLSGPPLEAARRVEEVICPNRGTRLRCGSMRPDIGRNRPQAQVQIEVVGATLQKVIAQRGSRRAVTRLRRDHVVLVDRKPLARLTAGAGKAPEVLWNLAVLEASGLDKQALLVELAVVKSGSS